MKVQLVTSMFLTSDHRKMVIKLKLAGLYLLTIPVPGFLFQDVRFSVSPLFITSMTILNHQGNCHNIAKTQKPLIHIQLMSDHVILSTLISTWTRWASGGTIHGEQWLMINIVCLQTNMSIPSGSDPLWKTMMFWNLLKRSFNCWRDVHKYLKLLMDK